MSAHEEYIAGCIKVREKSVEVKVVVWQDCQQNMADSKDTEIGLVCCPLSLWQSDKEDLEGH